MERVRDYLEISMGSMHHSQPRVISITQPTEIGAVYTLEEIAEISDFAHENGLLLHMDGARIFNAADSLGVGLNVITSYSIHYTKLYDYKNVRIKDIPTIDKSMVMKNYDRLVCRGELKKFELESFIGDASNSYNFV